MKSHQPDLRIDFRHFNDATKILMSYRKKFLTNICLARAEYFRLKKEIADYSKQTLPYGSCIGNYTTRYDDVDGRIRRYQYHALSHKNPVFPKIKEEKFSKKLHLGRDVNPHYREALVLIEQTRILEIKLETLKQITEHLTQLKRFYYQLCDSYRWTKKYQKNGETIVQNSGLEDAVQKLEKDFPEETLIDKLISLGFWKDDVDVDDVDDEDESIG